MGLLQYCATDSHFGFTNMPGTRFYERAGADHKRVSGKQASLNIALAFPKYAMHKTKKKEEKDGYYGKSKESLVWTNLASNIQLYVDKERKIFISYKDCQIPSRRRLVHKGPCAQRRHEKERTRLLLAN